MVLLPMPGILHFPNLERLPAKNGVNSTIHFLDVYCTTTECVTYVHMTLGFMKNAVFDH